MPGRFPHHFSRRATPVVTLPSTLIASTGGPHEKLLRGLPKLAIVPRSAHDGCGFSLAPAQDYPPPSTTYPGTCHHIYNPWFPSRITSKEATRAVPKK